jgi:hypothetical protein
MRGQKSHAKHITAFYSRSSDSRVLHSPIPTYPERLVPATDARRP